MEEEQLTWEDSDLSPPQRVKRKRIDEESEKSKEDSEDEEYLRKQSRYFIKKYKPSSSLLMSSCNSLTDLPLEMLLSIWQYLPPPFILSTLQRVCKLWMEVAADENLWKQMHNTYFGSWCASLDSWYSSAITIMKTMKRIEVETKAEMLQKKLIWAVSNCQAALTQSIIEEITNWKVPPLFNSVVSLNPSSIIMPDIDKKLLHYAAEKGDAKLLKVLVSTPGIDINTNDKSKESALHIAAYYGRRDCAKVLLEAGILCDTKDMNGKTPLYRASEKGHADIVHLLLTSSMVDVNSTNIDGIPPLHRAASKGHVAVAKELLGAYASVDAKDNDGLTALHSAAYYNCAPIVELLLSRKAAYDAQDRDKDTPFHSVARKGSAEAARVLVQHLIDLKDGITINLTNSDGETALGVAAKCGKTDVVEAFLKAPGILLDMDDNMSCTPLHHAVTSGYYNIMLMLLNRGADINRRDGEGRTAKQLAADSNYEQIKSLIQSYERGK